MSLVTSQTHHDGLLPLGAPVVQEDHELVVPLLNPDGLHPLLHHVLPLLRHHDEALPSQDDVVDEPARGRGGEMCEWLDFP